MIPPGIPAQAEAACLADPDRVPAVVVTAPLTHDSGVQAVLRAVQSVVRGGQEMQLFLLAGGPAEKAPAADGRDAGYRAPRDVCGPDARLEHARDGLAGPTSTSCPACGRRFTATRLCAMAAGSRFLRRSGTNEDYLIDGTTARSVRSGNEHQLDETCWRCWMTAPRRGIWPRQRWIMRGHITRRARWRRPSRGYIAR